MKSNKKGIKKNWPKYALIAPSTIILLVAFFLPILSLFSLSVYHGIAGSGLIDYSNPNLANFIEFFDPYNIKVMLRTLKMSLEATGIALLVGYPIAIAMTKGSNAKKSLLLGLILTPLVTNVVARTLGLMIIFGNGGPVNSFIKMLGFEGVQFLGEELGIVLGLVQVFTPYMVLSIKAVLENINMNLQEAARDMGCSRFKAFIKVVFPLSMPGVVAGCLFVYLLSFSSYVTPKLMGKGKIMTMSMYVYQQGMSLLNWPFAAAVAIVLLVTSLILVTLYNKMTSRIERMNDRTGNYRNLNYNNAWHRFVSRIGDFFYDIFAAIGRATDNIPGVKSLKKGLSGVFDKGGAIFVKLWTILGVVFIVCPLPIVIISSFTEASMVYFPPKGFSTKWYTGLLEKTEYIKSFLVSIKLAGIAVAVAVVFGTMVAIALSRYKFKFGNALKTFFLSPLMVPAVIFGLAAVRFASKFGWNASFKGLLAIHIIIATTYVIRTVLSSLIGFDVSIEEASRDLGANSWQTFWKVTFPIIRPSIIVAALFSFITSMDETTVSIFMVGGQSITLPVRVFSQLEYGLEPTITAISSLLVLFALIILFVIDRLIGLNKFKI
ncbi:MAG: ABC transporter permease subunit [Clostridiales bacterium]|nr:ABC transporter permease subunit [Clostridiales bacterium]